MPDTLEEIIEAGRSFYANKWVLGASGNFSIVESHNPLRLVITSSGLHKGRLSPTDFVEVDECCDVLSGSGHPSGEALIHIAIAEARWAGSILHTHSVWSTIVSQFYDGGFELSGYEMLKGLSGVRTHEHQEWIPIFENTQDYPAFAELIRTGLKQRPEVHCFLMRGHGLYTWGKDLQEAQRHVEILEFLFEVTGRLCLSRRAGG
jgi:methylthioribulose-1-phosphate dehydratase